MALYVFVYSSFFFYSKLAITGTASIILYFGYTLMMVFILFVFTGESNCFLFQHLVAVQLFELGPRG